jgi:hypothetical protein
MNERQCLRTYPHDAHTWTPVEMGTARTEPGARTSYRCEGIRTKRNSADFASSNATPAEGSIGSAGHANGPANSVAYCEHCGKRIARKLDGIWAHAETGYYVCLRADVEAYAVQRPTDDGRYGLSSDGATVGNMAFAYFEGRNADIVTTMRDVETVALARMIDACAHIVREGCALLQRERYSHPVPPVPPVASAVLDATLDKTAVTRGGVTFPLIGTIDTCRHCNAPITVRGGGSRAIPPVWNHDGTLSVYCQTNNGAKAEPSHAHTAPVTPTPPVGATGACRHCGVTIIVRAGKANRPVWTHAEAGFIYCRTGNDRAEPR